MTGPSKSRSSLRADDFSNAVIVDDTLEFGAALNDAVSRAPTDGTIIVPPAEFDMTTDVTIDKSVSIIGWGDQKKGPKLPRVTPTADVGILCTDSTFWQSIGWDYSGVTNTTIPLEANQSIWADDISITDSDTTAILLAMQTTGDNLNNSILKNLNLKSITGDGVRFENNTGDAVDLNACQTHVERYVGSGYAVNEDAGIANFHYVQNIEGSNISGFARMNGQRSYSFGQYIEGNVQGGVTFDNTLNIAEIVYGGGLSQTALRTDNTAGPNWLVGPHTDPTTPLWEQVGGTFAQRPTRKSSSPFQYEVDSGKMDIGDRVKFPTRGAPGTGAFDAADEGMLYVSDGTDTADAGDLRYAYYNGTTVSIGTVIDASTL